MRFRLRLCPVFYYLITHAAWFVVFVHYRVPLNYPGTRARGCLTDLGKWETVEGGGQGYGPRSL